MEEKIEKGQQIGQLPKRDVLTGNEQFPFQEDRENGSITPNALKSFISSGKGGYMSYITEYNVSIHHPSSGIDGSNRYTLEDAIVQVPETIRIAGLKVSFLNNSGLVETWEFAGGVFENIENWKSNEDKLTDIRDEAIDKIKDAESDAISNFSSQRVTPDMLSESTKQFINASGGGTINNLADDEDLVSVDKGENLSVLKFADRAYNLETHIGMGYKILRRNIIGGKNILTQDMINQSHTIYMIQYDFDLDGATIKIPEGCILDFQGGGIVNGKVFSDNKTTRIVNPPKITESNDKIFFGVFFDSNNGELTYRFEKINRPFEVVGQVATTRASKEYWNARRIGINKYNIFLPHVFSNGEWSFGDSNIEEAIELYKKYNIFMYNIRFEVRTDDLSDDRILEYSNMVKDKIDKLMANNIPVENIFLSNETPNVYNNYKWTSALIQLSDWVRKKGYKSGISHYTGMPSSIESYGAPQEYNSANFDKYGINLYPSLSPKGNNDLGYKPKQSDIIKAHNKFRTQFDYLVDRGYTSMTITETGFSEYNNGMYSVDDRTLPMDTTGYIYITAWKEWLNILSHYASMIDSMDVWVSPEIDRTSEAMYNILLNF
nr:MAG: hypothetical protein [Bacteriophage sp.]